MSFKYLKEHNLEEPRMIAIIEGTGSGTKLLQSLLDSHPEVCMIPGYALMYFYPYWEEYITKKKINDWAIVLESVINTFSSIFDTSINPGSETLDQLGENQDESLSVDIDKFRSFFLLFTKGESVTAKNSLIAIHYAYAYATGESLSTKKAIVYHIHVFFYAKKYLYRDFPNLQVIAAIRDQRANIRKRVQNSIIKPNQTKLRDSDEFLMRQTAYRHIIRFTSEGLDSLSPISRDKVRVFKHEDLVTRLEQVMLNLAQFLNIEFTNSLLKPTWGGLVWQTTYYDFDSKASVANPSVLSKDWVHLQSPIEIFFIEGLSYDSIKEYYGNLMYYKKNTFSNVLTTIFLSLIPRPIEMKYFFQLLRVDKYMAIVFRETQDIQSLRSYQNNLFYSLKWTNSGINFAKLDILRLANKPVNLNNSKLLRTGYFLSRIISYALALASIPVNYGLRVLTSFSVIKRRVSSTRLLPEVL